MIDRQDEGSAVGSNLVESSDRLFHWWHKYRDPEMAWSTFLGHARPIRWGVRQALDRGAVCANEKTAATCIGYSDRTGPVVPPDARSSGTVRTLVSVNRDSSSLICGMLVPHR
jgi:hypothetical protein